MDFDENEKLLVDSLKAAMMLDISPRTLWQLTKDKKIPYVKVGKLKKYSKSSLLKWIEEQMQNR